jgi:hypothetical protein
MMRRALLVFMLVLGASGLGSYAQAADTLVTLCDKGAIVCIFSSQLASYKAAHPTAVLGRCGISAAK